MVRKETYRGMEEEALKNITLEDFSQLVASRERRTLKRMNNYPAYQKLVMKIRALKKKGMKKPIKTEVRDAVIIPEWLGLRFAVHNGKEWKQFDITLEKLGRRLGEFAHTTGPVRHSGPGVGATRGSKFVPLK